MQTVTAQEMVEQDGNDITLQETKETGEDMGSYRRAV